ncbi:CdaR family transcriptional regulator [Ornithinibacillus salinisoli]|uniref:CdaR family transcriptional regulator n=1 Tax=Ornithinibacillus salinisoli TaxID=1848459 RepID=A0ABW4VXV8_9BACI
MELTAELGSKIINEARKLINENIIIVNTQAIIIASTDASRIGQFHEGAEKTIETNSVIVLTREHQKTMQGIKPGINLPITINQKVIGVIGITGNPTEITPFASLMKKMTELLIRESMYIQESEWESRALEVLFLDWIQLDSLPPDFLSRAEVLGIKHTSPLRCSLLYIHDNPESHQINDLKRWLDLTLDSTLIRWGNNRLLLLTEEKDQSKSKLYLHSQLTSFQTYARTHLHVKTSIGIGSTVDSNVIKSSYQNAVKALRVAMNSQAIIFYEDLLLEICLDDVDHHLKKEFINRIISPIQEEDQLLHTLKVFLENNLHLKNTAKELHIHINTLHYRLKRIEKLTNLNPKATYSIASFYSALYYLDEKTK